MFLVNTKHEDRTTPALCTLVKDQQTIDLAGGEEFMTAYVPIEMYAEGD